MGYCSAHLLFEGEKKSGRKGKGHEPHRNYGLKAVLAESLLAYFKNAYAETPAMNKPAPTAAVPSGSGVRDEVVEDEVTDL